MASRDDIKFLSNPKIGGRKKKYCLTGNSLKYQRKVGNAIKRARHLAMLPYLTDLLK